MSPEETAVTTAEPQFFPCSFLSEFNYCSVSYASLAAARTRKRKAKRLRAKQRARDAALAATELDAPTVEETPTLDTQVSISPSHEIKSMSPKTRLKRLRDLAHRAFDPLWMGEGAPMTRNQAYVWLSQTLNIPRELTHMSLFSESQCRTVLAAIENRDLLEQINPKTKWSKVQRRRRAKNKPILHHVIREEKALASFR